MTVHPAEATRLSLALVSWLVIGSLLCLLPMGSGGASLPYSDKLGHIALFGLGGLILGWCRLLPIALAWFLLLGQGALLELLQASGGFRHAEWSDLAADAFGAALGLFLSQRSIAVSKA